MNITKIENGFKIDSQDFNYLFKGLEHEVLSEDQCHINTNMGIIFFDTSVSIEGKTFLTIEDWITELYK
jgi:hypothetical protein